MNGSRIPTFAIQNLLEPMPDLVSRWICTETNA